MEIFGYTIIKTCELRHQQFTQKDKHDAEIKQLKNKIVQLENKVDNQRFQIEEATYAKNRAQRERAMTENCYQKVCKENRHLAAEIERIKKRGL